MNLNGGFEDSLSQFDRRETASLERRPNALDFFVFCRHCFQSLELGLRLIIKFPVNNASSFKPLRFAVLDQVEDSPDGLS